MRALSALVIAMVLLRDQLPTTVGTASLTGTVQIMVGGQPSPVRRARVTLRDVTGATHTADTDTLGQFRVDQLKGGSYRVVVDKPGFVPIGRVPMIEVRPGQTASATVLMQRGHIHAPGIACRELHRRGGAGVGRRRMAGP